MKRGSVMLLMFTGLVLCGSLGLFAAPESHPRKRLWDRAFLAGFNKAAPGQRITFELVSGELASGEVGYLARTNGEVIHLAGKLTEPERGRFFFQRQTRPGVAGDFVGVVELPGSERAYRIEPSGPGGAPELVERALGEVICLRLPLAPASTTNRTAKIPPLNPGDFPELPVPDYQNGISLLESLHGATAVIYLDFQGGYTPTWGGVTYERPAMTNAQIREVWRRVAEDFMPFNINVTTDLKTYEAAAAGSRQRVIVTPTTTAAPDAGGVALIGSFNYTGEMPCWVFLTTPKACAEACSHELGHALGLAGHKGQDYNGQHVEYYLGQGDGETGWAPIMGVGYYRNVTQWSRGEYLDADNSDDELNQIVNHNNDVAYRPDDTGDTLATSRYLELYTDNSAGAEGLIERTADTDAFQFTTGGGLVSLRAEPVSVGPNLALAVSLCDANDMLLASNCPQATLAADLSTNLPAGTYTFRVTGAGRNDALTNGFSSYASLGYYSITGSVANARLPDRFAVREHATNGTVIGVIASRNSSGDPLACELVSGNTSNTFALDSSGLLTVANSLALDYAMLATQTQFTVQFELFVNLVDLPNPSLSETNRRVVVAVLPIVGPPVIIQQPQSLRVGAGQNVTLIVDARGALPVYEPLQYQWFFNGTAMAGATNSWLSAQDLQAPVAGNYVAVITNLGGATTSSVATLTVAPALPVFSREPDPLERFVGSSAVFQAEASGTEPIGYQWQLNGMDLAGQTNSGLWLPSLRVRDAGMYRAVASNAVGSEVSAGAELWVDTVFAWGWNDFGQTNLPVGLTDVVQISAGNQHSLALLREGRVVAWGTGPQTNVPRELSGVIGIAAGGSHSLALKADGTVSVWGDDSAGQTRVPLGLSNVTAVAAGEMHSLALRPDGTVVAWGSNQSGQCNVPSGLSNVVAIAAGGNHSLVLRADGTVLDWGDNLPGQLQFPANLSDVVAIAAGGHHSLALRVDGTIASWGSNDFAQTTVPVITGGAVAIAAGGYHNLALRADGAVIAWGAGKWGGSNFPQEAQATVPSVVAGIAAVAAGEAHSLVLAGDGAPFITETLMSRCAYRGSRVIFRVAATGAAPLSFQWQFNGTNLAGATGRMLVLDEATNAGAYRVVVSNEFGMATSTSAELILVPEPRVGHYEALGNLPNQWPDGGGGIGDQHFGSFTVSFSTGGGFASFQLNWVTFEFTGGAEQPWTSRGVAIYQQAGTNNILLGQLGIPALDPQLTRWPEYWNPGFCTTYVDFLPNSPICLQPGSQYLVTAPNGLLLFTGSSNFLAAAGWGMGPTITSDPWAAGEFIMFAMDVTPNQWPCSSPSNVAPVVQLMATKAGTNLWLQWPVGPYKLYTGDSLGPVSWVPVPDTPFRINSDLILNVPLSGASRCFQLRPP